MSCVASDLVLVSFLLHGVFHKVLKIKQIYLVLSPQQLLGQIKM